jgi:type IV pilus assembly protein PilE
MRRHSGFTLIELMIAVIVIAILTAIAYPSYKSHLMRGYRNAGKQFLADVAQRQEQYLLDQRQYAPTLAALNMTVPAEVAARYQAPAFTVPAGATPPTYSISLAPAATGIMTGDGALIINSLGQRWRDTNSNGTYEAASDQSWER